MYITICEIDDQSKFDAWSRALKAPEGWGEEEGGGVVQDVGTHVHPWLIEIYVCQKPP